MKYILTVYKVYTNGEMGRKKKKNVRSHGEMGRKQKEVLVNFSNFQNLAKYLVTQMAEWPFCII